MNTEPDARRAPVDPAVAALARAMERIARKVEALDGDVRRLADHPGPAPTAPVERAAAEGLRCFLLAEDPGVTAAAVVDLVGWLDRVYVHYADSALSSCWLWHPAVVEELWWLRCAHADAYDDEVGSWLRVGDWHDRQRPGVARRVRAVLGTCQLSRHVAGRDRPGSVTAPPATPLAAHAADIAAAWTTGHLMPEPTPAQLHDGQTFQRTHLGRTP